MKVVTNKGPLNVLFLCTGNSARSVIAEVVLNRLGSGRFKAFSAGSQPAGEANPNALRVLELAHYDVSGLRSKPWEAFSAPGAPKLDFVFTGFRQRRKGDLPDLAGPADDRPLGPA